MSVVTLAVCFPARFLCLFIQLTMSFALATSLFAVHLASQFLLFANFYFVSPPQTSWPLSSLQRIQEIPSLQFALALEMDFLIW